MSKICGVLHFGGAPVSEKDRAFVRKMLHAPGYRSVQEHGATGIFIGWAAGSEPQRGSGIAASTEGNVGAWDGRLDNGTDLLRLTGLPEHSAASALLLAIYRQCGAAGFRELVGDWAACIYEAAPRTVVLASDYAGVRPLYYYRNGESVYWCSSLGDLVLWTGVTAIDELYAANFLARGSAPGRTPYQGILPVPPGHAVSISQDGIAERAFWNPPLDAELRYGDEQAYEGQLLELFRDSVKARIDGAGRVCAELSGGLDSSSVVSMADQIRRAPQNADFDLRTFSYTHDQCPDEKYFREVERACDLTGCHLQLKDYPAIAADGAGAAPAWWQPRFRELAQRAAEMDAGIFLTGQLGDCIMGNTLDDSDQVTEWIAQKNFRRAAGTAYAWARAMQVPIYPILWRSLREAYTSWVPSASPYEAVGVIRGSRENSLCASTRNSLEQLEHQREAVAPWRYAPPGRRRRLRAVGEMLQSRILQAPEALQHLSYTHPFAHRPLVEFMLSIPAHLVCSPGHPRRLMRRAFANLLPPPILQRKSKAAYTGIYMGALVPLAAELLKRPAGIQVVERGYVDAQSLIGRLEKFTQGLECNEAQLRPLILFEFWLRNRVAAKAAPTAELVLS